MIQRIVYCLVWQCLFLTVNAQLHVSGTVVSADTHLPVVAANVYLNNSTVGTLTDEKGQFTIAHFPNGRFDLVVSFIGYETYHITLQSNQLPGHIAISLKPATQELQEVVVETYDKNGWKKWGRLFLDNFMGTSANARNCKLKNPGDVHFRYSNKQQMVIATGADLLIIENKALGYVLKYNLTRFEYRKASGEFFIQGYALFENMVPRNTRQENAWLEKRKNAYYGSMMHFMRSLFQNKIIEQRFEVRKMVTLTDQQKDRYKKRYENRLDDPDNPIPQDSLPFYESVIGQYNYSRVLVNKLLKGDDIAYLVDSVTIGFDFDDRLQIVYREKQNPREHRPIVSNSPAYGPDYSEIYLLHKKALAVLGNGSFFDGGDLMISGHWSWSEKMCNKLPYDYWPGK